MHACACMRMHASATCICRHRHARARAWNAFLWVQVLVGARHAIFDFGRSWEVEGHL